MASLFKYWNHIPIFKTIRDNPTQYKKEKLKIISEGFDTTQFEVFRTLGLVY